MKVTTEWICDSCGEPILGARQGWVEWQSAKYQGVEGPRAKGLRLVHAYPSSPRRKRESRCQYDRAHFSSHRSEYMIRDMALAEMTGPDGLQVLLRLIKEGELPADEVLAMIRRLRVPGFEHARLHFEEAKETDVICEDHDLDLCTQETIERILGHASYFDDCELCPFLTSRP